MDYDMKQKYHFFPENENISFVSTLLSSYLTDRNHQNDNWGILCIGTDRITGDCLGPMVGSRLISRSVKLPVYGTLQHPVHAVNLPYVLSTLKRQYPLHRFLAIDAAVGPKKHLGSISISGSSLKPGGGLQKSLPSVGDISITGIVGEEGSCSELTLPYTRLYLVDKLAEFISQCILRCF